MLSVICPIYNEVKYIDVCIQSVLLQDYPKEQLEVLFVDGMSRDGTRERVLEYAREYPFIKLIDNPKDCSGGDEHLVYGHQRRCSDAPGCPCQLSDELFWGFGEETL